MQYKAVKIIRHTLCHMGHFDLRIVVHKVAMIFKQYVEKQGTQVIQMKTNRFEKVYA